MHLGEVRGDLDTVFKGLFRKESRETARLESRLVIETKSPTHYRVLFSYGDRGLETARKLAETLGLVVEQQQRSMTAFALVKGTESPTAVDRFLGQPKWPELRISDNVAASGEPPLFLDCEKRLFVHGGVYRRKGDDDNLYFDGVSFDDLASYMEEETNIPVVNATGDALLYSFRLPGNVFRRDYFTRPVALPGLGVSVSYQTIDIEMIVVRDKEVTAH